ncbi:MAG TPA: Gfo/Idh/MocA family oxidoreductase [Pararobbsia sp.]|nr:Gfo/Idh/MocA family oxidoreductase [Pararobbsia sp.]
MTRTIRWGILGPGRIATQFAQGVQAAPNAELVAIGSRSIDSAHRFADQFNVARRHGSYAALANDPDVDVIYIALPHPFHADATMLCLDAGKAVLCEKPFTVNLAEAQRVVAHARQKRVFLMEGLWTRFIPAVVHAKALVDSGAIGTPKMVQADFGAVFNVDDSHRAMDPALAGGALLDIGIYPISVATFFLGPVEDVQASAAIGHTGVDEQIAVSMRHRGGGLSLSGATMLAASPFDAVITGTTGRIRLNGELSRPRSLTLTRGDSEEHIELPYDGNGFQFQADHVGECLRAGKLESDLLPLDHTLATMKVLDTARERIGLRYPFE